VLLAILKNKPKNVYGLLFLDYRNMAQLQIITITTTPCQKIKFIGVPFIVIGTSINSMVYNSFVPIS